MKKYAAAAFVAFTLFTLTVSGGVITQVTEYLGSKVRKLNKHEVNMGLADERLKPRFTAAHVAYPPKTVWLLFTKDQKLLSLYAGESDASLKLIHSYPVLAASGHVGPKLKEGDEQVPEGIYRITALNPNSQFHLSLRVGYPNAFDKEQAAKEKRGNLGGDIMIHGNAVSIGCVAIGNVAIEEVYRLAEKTKYRDWQVLFTPVDFRSKKLSAADRHRLPWTDSLYTAIETQLRRLP